MDMKNLPLLQDLAPYVDKFKIGQVVRNLVTNAVKFTPAGEAVPVNNHPAKEAAISEGGRKPLCGSEDAQLVGFTFRSAGHAIIEVVFDTGTGSTPEDHSKVFGAFAQFRSNELQIRDAL